VSRCSMNKCLYASANVADSELHSFALHPSSPPSTGALSLPVVFVYASVLFGNRCVIGYRNVAKLLPF
jgi:hypothetical protein